MGGPPKVYGIPTQSYLVLRPLQAGLDMLEVVRRKPVSDVAIQVIEPRLVTAFVRMASILLVVVAETVTLDYLLATILRIGIVGLD